MFVPYTKPVVVPVSVITYILPTVGYTTILVGAGLISVAALAPPATNNPVINVKADKKRFTQTSAEKISTNTYAIVPKQ
jgi:hypothetical protein